MKLKELQTIDAEELASAYWPVQANAAKAG